MQVLSRPLGIYIRSSYSNIIIRVSNPPQKHPPSLLPSLPLNLETAQALPFLGNPSLHIGFSWNPSPPLIGGFFSGCPKYQSFSSLNPSYLLKVTKFLVIPLFSSSPLSKLLSWFPADDFSHSQFTPLDLVWKRGKYIGTNLVGIYMFKVNTGITAMFETRHNLNRFLLNFEPISHIVLLSPLLALNK